MWDVCGVSHNAERIFHPLLLLCLHCLSICTRLPHTPCSSAVFLKENGVDLFPRVLYNCMAEIERGYSWQNPSHNAFTLVRAKLVFAGRAQLSNRAFRSLLFLSLFVPTQPRTCFLLRSVLTPLDVLAACMIVISCGTAAATFRPGGMAWHAAEESKECKQSDEN